MSQVPFSNGIASKGFTQCKATVHSFDILDTIVLTWDYSEGRPGVFATTINILPGTHHIRFLVDNNMQTSPDLPTTVDFGNNLVNYIEINPDDVPPVPAEASAAAPDQDEKTLAERSASQASSSSKPPRERPVVPAERYSYDIPRYLVDFDQPEDTPLYQSAVGAIEKLPTPPSLPGFLGKPILNAAVLIKDDNSVLNMPNHTVLNHLATSSIKNNVLAVSATTRYKSKVCRPKPLFELTLTSNPQSSTSRRSYTSPQTANLGAQIPNYL